MNNYFQPYAQKGNEFLDLLLDRMGRGIEADQAVRILRAVLHTIRDQVPVNVSIQFISSLPMVVKALYVDGWKPGRKKPSERTKAGFLHAIRAKEKPLLAAHDFKDEAHASKMVGAVIQTLQWYVSEGEQKDLFAVLPAEIRTWMEEWTSEKFHIL